MSRQLIGALLLVFFAVLAFSYVGVIPLGDSSPRPVSEDGAADGNGDADNGGDAATGEPVELGRSIYQEQCSGCHANDDSDSVGPSFAGLYGSEVAFEDGSTTVVDGEHIIESVTDPQAKIREGYPSVMPSFSDLSEDELAGIVAYIQSLE